MIKGKFGMVPDVIAFSRKLIGQGFPPTEVIEFWRGTKLILRGTAADFAGLSASEPAAGDRGPGGPRKPIPHARPCAGACK